MVALSSTIMLHVSRPRKNPRTFRSLTGLTPQEFDVLLAQLAPRYQEWNHRRLDRPNRRRKVGGGTRFSLELPDRLLLLLLYYRTYVTYPFLAFLFHVHEGSPGRLFKPLEPLLAGIFRIPEKKISLSEDEIADLFFDGTEQPTNRPGKKQRKWYSGKKKHHTVKHQVVVVRKKKKSGPGMKKRKVRIAAVSKTFVGKTHDKKMYIDSRTTSPPESKRKGDTGYLGTVLQIPHKKPKDGTLTKRQKRANRAFSSKRVSVEHGIGKMKIWRLCRDQFRGRRKDHALAFKNIAGLHNLMFA